MDEEDLREIQGSLDPQVGQGELAGTVSQGLLVHQEQWLRERKSLVHLAHLEGMASLVKQEDQVVKENGELVAIQDEMVNPESLDNEETLDLQERRVLKVGFFILDPNVAGS